MLQSHGALDQFSQLQGEAGRIEANVESLRQRFEAADVAEALASRDARIAELEQQLAQLTAK